MTALTGPKWFPNVGFSSVDFAGFPKCKIPIVYFNDFEAAGLVNEFSVTALATPWLVTGANSGLAAAVGATDPYILQTPGASGLLTVACDSTSGDEEFAQLQSLAFPFTTGRRAVFAVRVTISTITTSNQNFGMYETITSVDPVDTQPVGFGVTVASGVVQYMVKTSAATTAPTAIGMTVAAAAVITILIEWDGAGTIKFSVFNHSTGALATASVSLASFTATTLGPAFGIDTASGAQKTMILDYIYAAVEPAAAGR